jgi:hypothetical protein
MGIAEKRIVRSVWKNALAAIGLSAIFACQTQTAPTNRVLGRLLLTSMRNPATIVDGWGLVVSVVAWQSGINAETVKKQRTETGLSFGDLLVANSLATGSGRSFNEIRAGAKWQSSCGSISIRSRLVCEQPPNPSSTQRVVARSGASKTCATR